MKQNHTKSKMNEITSGNNQFDVAKIKENSMTKYSLKIFSLPQQENNFRWQFNVRGDREDLGPDSIRDSHWW